MKKILEEAIRDAEALRESAVENAKNVLIEAVAPKINEFMEQQFGEAEISLPEAEENEEEELELPDMEEGAFYEGEEAEEEKSL